MVIPLRSTGRESAFGSKAAEGAFVQRPTSPPRAPSTALRARSPPRFAGADIFLACAGTRGLRHR